MPTRDPDVMQIHCKYDSETTNTWRFAEVDEETGQVLKINDRRTRVGVVYIRKSALPEPPKWITVAITFHREFGSGT